MIDASMKMPESWGPRGYWRYRNVSAKIGFVVLPIALLLNVIAIPSAWQSAAGIGLVIFMVAVAIFFIWRDRIVQKRIDETGSPISYREPY